MYDKHGLFSLFITYILYIIVDMTKVETVMKIAIPYINGKLNQRFGMSEQFKIYDIEKGQIIKAEIVDTNGEAHQQLAEFLAKQNVDAVMCGHIGMGMKGHLEAYDIDIFSGFQGPCDIVIQHFLNFA